MPWILLAVGVIAILAARSKPTLKLSDLAHEELDTPHDGYTHFVIYQDSHMHNYIRGRFASLADADKAVRDPWGFGSDHGLYFIYSYEAGRIVVSHAFLK